MTVEELAELKKRVVAMEEFLRGVKSLLVAFDRSRQGSLLDAPVDGTAGSELVAMREMLVERFEKKTAKKYVYAGAKDTEAIKRLLKLDPRLRPELLDRWEEAFTREFKGTTSIAGFVARINDFGRRTAMVPAVVKEDPYGS